MDLKGEKSTKTNHVHHLALVPCPLQGHLNPMLHLANLLLASGFSVTVIQIPSPRWSSIDCLHPSFPGLFFEPIGDGVHCDDDASNAGGDVMSFLLELNAKCRDPFRNCLERVQSDASRGRLSCIIHDAVMYFPVDGVEDLGIPRLVLRTSTAANFIGLSLLDQKGFLPSQEVRLMEGLQELPSMRVKDLPLFDKCSQESTGEVLIKIHEGTVTASAIIWNTLPYLEQSSLDKILVILSIPVFPIGPLHRMSAEITEVQRTPGSQNTEGRGYAVPIGEDTQPGAEDRSCIEWLDSQPLGSVVYVSFGSLVALSDHELSEISLGLAESGHPFLWVIRAGHVNLASLDSIRELADTSKTGKITSWAPQREVLAHPSVGCFWTHNGWNSTLESMCEGVPMLCWPNVGDQRIISRLVSGEWKVGLELEISDDGADSRTVNRTRVSSAIRRMMSDDEGTEMTRRAMALKEQIDVSLGPGGSSCQFLQNLVAFIHQLPNEE